MSAETTLTQSEFARQAGVSRQAVNQALANGRLPADGKKVALGGSTAKDLWDATADPSPGNQTRRMQFEEARQRSNTTPTEKNAPAASQRAGEAMPPIERLSAALKLETYKLQKARAETANVELDKLAGSLVERAEVDYLLTDFGNSLRGLLEGLPDRLAASIARHRGDVTAIHAEIESAATEILTELADHMARKMDAL